MIHVRVDVIAKFRCGVAPLRIATGRYMYELLTPEQQRVCFNSPCKVEDELFTECPLQTDLRQILYLIIMTISPRVCKSGLDVLVPVVHLGRADLGAEGMISGHWFPPHVLCCMLS